MFYNILHELDVERNFGKKKLRSRIRIFFDQPLRNALTRTIGGEEKSHVATPSAGPRDVHKSRVSHPRVFAPWMVPWDYLRGGQCYLTSFSCCFLRDYFSTGIFQSIGLKQFDAYLRASEPSSELLAQGLLEMKIANRRYSRYQVKWIKKRFLQQPDRQVFRFVFVLFLGGTAAIFDELPVQFFFFLLLGVSLLYTFLSFLT